ncbi:MAG: hypothetical protein HY827_04625 [Actinobacteria bacterium]|nr:hypothetical protein [Actinomycetota bacterium]
MRPNPFISGTKSRPVDRLRTGVPRDAVTYGHFRVAEVGWDFYSDVCRAIGFPGVIAPELLGHFAGETDTGWEVVDLWDEPGAMERVFGHFLVDAISRTIAESPSRSDIQPDQHLIARLIVGPSASRYAEIDPESGEDALAHAGLNPIGVMFENLGGDEADYLRGCGLLGFPDTLPEGLVLHVAGPCDGGWRAFDCFDDLASMDRWHRRVSEVIGQIAETGNWQQRYRMRRIEVKRLFVSPDLTGGGYLPR